MIQLKLNRLNNFNFTTDYYMATILGLPHGLESLIHHPLSIILRCRSCALGKAKMSVTQLLVSTYFTDIIPLFIFYLKWLYFRPMCFVIGLILGHFTNSIHDLLSSNTTHWILGTYVSMGDVDVSSFSKHITGAASLIECDSAMYLASVIDILISVCNLDKHYIGHSAYRTM